MDDYCKHFIWHHALQYVTSKYCLHLKGCILCQHTIIFSIDYIILAGFEGYWFVLYRINTLLESIEYQIKSKILVLPITNVCKMNLKFAALRKILLVMMMSF